MQKPATLICLLLIPLCRTNGQAQPNKDPVVIVATASEYVPRSTTVSRPGHSYTNCMGGTSYFGRFSGYGDSGSVSGTAESNTVCRTTFTPPTEATLTTYLRVNYTVVKGEHALYLLSCTQRWKLTRKERVLAGLAGGIAGGSGASTDAADKIEQKAVGTWTDCPAFVIGSQYSLTLRSASDARLESAAGGKPTKVDYLSSATVPEAKAESISPPRAEVVSTTERATDKRQDGHWWAIQGEEFRLGYLTGYVGALNTVSNILDRGGKEYPGFRFGNYTIGQILDELQRFYSDPSNQHIQVPGAITWVKNKIEGTSQQDLQRQLEFLRKEDSQPDR